MALIRFFLLTLVTAFVTLLLYDSFCPPISTLMIGRTFTLQRISRRYVPLNHISPHVARAAIAAEDGKFCHHHGVDWQALGDAVEDAADDDGKSHGASTIPMQLTKNLFLWPGRSYLRKGIELPLALGLDAIWSKHRIMENYLNIAEFGPGIFGIESAAQQYFRISARALSPRQAALLIATLPSPKRRNPTAPGNYMANYAASIEGRMWQQDTSCLK